MFASIRAGCSNCTLYPWVRVVVEVAGFLEVSHNHVDIWIFLNREIDFTLFNQVLCGLVK